MTKSTAVAERMDQSPANVSAHPASDTTALIAMIERVALNPAIDIDKMERLLEMQERILNRNAKIAFTSALAEMQPKLPVVDRKGNITIHKKDADKIPANVIQSTPYALWEDINDAIRPCLAEHGFAISFRIKKESDRVEVTAILSHRDGHSEETMLSLPMDSTGSKNNVQAIGSSTSYGKRYTACALLNITSRGEDDDGKTAGAEIAINDQQREELAALLDETATDEARFYAFFKIEYLAELPANRFGEAKAMLETKKKAARK
jgi:hypothetical protein